MNDARKTTITVQAAVGDRLRAMATRTGVSTAVALEGLLEEAERREVVDVVAEESERWRPLLDRLR